MRELLGTPDVAPGKDDVYLREGFDWGYVLGIERESFPIDSEWLGVSFDDDGLVDETGIYTD